MGSIVAASANLSVHISVIMYSLNLQLSLPSVDHPLLTQLHSPSFSFELPPIYHHSSTLVSDHPSLPLMYHYTLHSSAFHPLSIPLPLSLPPLPPLTHPPLVFLLTPLHSARTPFLAILIYCTFSFGVIGFEEIYSVWAATHPYFGRTIVTLCAAI